MEILALIFRRSSFVLTSCLRFLAASCPQNPWEFAGKAAAQILSEKRRGDADKRILVSPKILEARRGELRVHRRILNILVTKVELYRSGVLRIICGRRGLKGYSRATGVGLFYPV